MVGEPDRAALEYLSVWRGPLPFDLALQPEALTEFAREHEAGTVVIDSLKDVALDLKDDGTGGRVNLALQHLCAADIEVLVLHHQRKASSDNRAPRNLADVYGSTWLTAGAGSVVLLWGEPGDPLVELRHLKQPDVELGPLTLSHDHARGVTSVHEAPDLLGLVSRAPDGLSAPEACRLVLDSSKPRPADVEKVRRKLERLVVQSLAEKVPAQPPEPVRYRKAVGHRG